MISMAQVMSSMLCVYGSQMLLVVSRHALRAHDISAKFKAVQLSVLSLSLPGPVLRMIGVHRADTVYSAAVMTAAYVACIRCICFFFLALPFRHYFDERMARRAYTNVGQDAESADDKGGSRLEAGIHEQADRAAAIPVSRDEM